MSSDEAKQLEKERKQEEKEKKAMEKAKAKIIDENDEMFCGFCSVQMLDGDGIQRMVKGTSAQVPLRAVHSGDKVQLVANFSTNPLFHVAINNDSNQYIFGRMWYAAEKTSGTGEIGSVVPHKCDKLCSALEDGGNKAEIKFEMPFLENAGDRLQKCTVGVVEERFQTKLKSMVVELSKADWLEWKQYRVRFWTQGKVWGGDGKPGPEEKDDDKDKEDKDKKEEK